MTSRALFAWTVARPGTPEFSASSRSSFGNRIQDRRRGRWVPFPGSAWADLGPTSASSSPCGRTRQIPAVRESTGSRVNGADRHPVPAPPAPPKIDFRFLDGLAGTAADEIRQTEDALVAYVAAEEKRSALYAGPRTDLTAKYPALAKGR